MKKRKPPILLTTVLVIMLVAVGVMYSPRGIVGEQDEHQAPPPPSAEQGTRPTVTSDQVSAMATANIAGDKGPGGPELMQPSKPGRPSIAVPKQQAYKPKPNDSSTSTQWYTDQTRK